MSYRFTGKLEGGTFESDEMSAKCPSKYEEEATAKSGPEGRKDNSNGKASGAAKAPAGAAAPKGG